MCDGGARENTGVSAQTHLSRAALSENGVVSPSRFPPPHNDVIPGLKEARLFDILLSEICENIILYSNYLYWLH